jgi:hypothetical protein
MPNYCYCTLWIDGPAADLADLRRRVTTDEHGHHCLFESLVPMPKDLRDTTSPSPLETGTIYDDETKQKRLLTNDERKHLESLVVAHGHADLCSWQQEHWGVKRGDCQTEMNADDEFMEFEFWTPWVPPLPAISAIAAMFPSLSFRLKYDEPNDELLGIVKWSDGKLAQHRAA